MQGLIGHHRVAEFFQTALSHERLSHAYLLVGRPGLGKKTLAQILAAQLLSTTTDRLAVCPDYLCLSRQHHEKTGKLKKDISIEQIREVITFFSQRALTRDGYKVVIIDNAEELSAAAAHALLKTLEEPRSRNLLFLVTRDDQVLLPTIRSRCQTIYFSAVADAELIAFARSRGADEPRAKEMAMRARGIPGRVVAWLNDETDYTEHIGEQNRFTQLLGKPLYEKSQQVSELFGDKTDHIAARATLLQTLDIWHETIHDFLKSGSESVSVQRLLAVESRIVEAKRLLPQNIHPRLLIETILLALP